MFSWFSKPAPQPTPLTEPTDVLSATKKFFKATLEYGFSNIKYSVKNDTDYRNKMKEVMKFYLDDARTYKPDIMLMAESDEIDIFYASILSASRIRDKDFFKFLLNKLPITVAQAVRDHIIHEMDETSREKHATMNARSYNANYKEEYETAVEYKAIVDKIIEEKIGALEKGKLNATTLIASAKARAGAGAGAELINVEHLISSARAGGGSGSGSGSGAGVGSLQGGRRKNKSKKRSIFKKRSVRRQGRTRRS